MNLQLKPESKRDLARWELRQKQDGYLVWFMVIVSSFPVVNFLAAPTVTSKLVLCSFLVGLGISCLRLLNSAAKVVALRQLTRSSHEIFGAANMGHSEMQPDHDQARLN